MVGYRCVRKERKRTHIQISFCAHFNHFPLHADRCLRSLFAIPDTGIVAAQAEPRNWRHSKCMRQARASEAIVINFFGAGKSHGQTCGAHALSFVVPAAEFLRACNAQCNKTEPLNIYTTGYIRFYNYTYKCGMRCIEFADSSRVEPSRVVSYGKCNVRWKK